MLHFLACAAVAYFLARYFNARFPSWITAVWSSGVATIAGLVVGSVVVLGALILTGVQLDHNALPRAIGQALIWSAIGAAAGIYQGRRASPGGAAGSTPTKALIGWAAAGLVVAFGIIAVIGKLIPEQQADHQGARPSVTPGGAPPPSSVQPKRYLSDEEVGFPANPQSTSSHP